jgi:hypothetical protein
MSLCTHAQDRLSAIGTLHQLHKVTERSLTEVLQQWENMFPDIRIINLIKEKDISWRDQQSAGSVLEMITSLFLDVIPVSLKIATNIKGMIMIVLGLNENAGNKTGWSDLIRFELGKKNARIAYSAELPPEIVITLSNVV